jgi:hypothetical protein
MTNLQTSKFIALAACLISLSLMGQNRFLADSGRIHFVSEAPLELIEAETNRFKLIVDTAQAAFAVTMQIEDFKGFNSALQQEHFYENYMETGLFPKATFVGKILSPIQKGSEAFNLQVKGKLNIHGIEKNRIIEVECRWLENGHLLAQAEFIVPLEDHNIEIPRIVYRKIAEEIQISVSAELSPLD